MELGELGLDQWFADHARQRCGAGLDVARVTAVDRSGYLVRSHAGEIPAELTGRYLHRSEAPTDLPCVGDWACVQCLDAGSRAIIHDVLPRKSFLRRKAPGRSVEFQMIAANIDVAFIVQSCHFDFNLRRLERYLVVVREGHIEPVLLLTKTDLLSDAALQAMIEEIRCTGIDARVIPLSNVTGTGIDEVRRIVSPGRTYCLLGSSGVGKTTLINQLAGDGILKTGGVSHTGEGRHTTTRRQLVVLQGGGLLIDMPGMRELGMLAVGGGLGETFADVEALARDCRFADCSHTTEPGCAVRAAIDRGELAEEHVRSFAKLRRESAFHDMSYAERRRREREFGRLVRSVTRQKRQRDPG